MPLKQEDPVYSYERVGDHYRLHDAQDNAVGSCYVERNAQLIVDALNRKQDAMLGRDKSSDLVRQALRAFGAINVHRCDEVFKSCKDWKDADWGVALAGEVGELLNIVKKIRRDGSTPELEAKLAAEAADVQTYLSLWMAKRGTDLGDAVVKKFNEVSQRRGYSMNF